MSAKSQLYDSDRSLMTRAIKEQTRGVRNCYLPSQLLVWSERALSKSYRMSLRLYIFKHNEVLGFYRESNNESYIFIAISLILYGTDVTWLFRVTR